MSKRNSNEDVWSNITCWILNSESCMSAAVEDTPGLILEELFELATPCVEDQCPSTEPPSQLQSRSLNWPQLMFQWIRLIHRIESFFHFGKQCLTNLQNNAEIESVPQIYFYSAVTWVSSLHYCSLPISSESTIEEPPPAQTQTLNEQLWNDPGNLTHLVMKP